MDTSVEQTAGPFGWLKDPRGRRSALVHVHMAVRRGWLAGPEMADRRAALVDALVALAEDPTLRPAEVIRIARIVAAMAADSLSRSGRGRKPIRLRRAEGKGDRHDRPGVGAGH